MYIIFIFRTKIIILRSRKLFYVFGPVPEQPVPSWSIPRSARPEKARADPRLTPLNTVIFVRNRLFSAKYEYFRINTVILAKIRIFSVRIGWALHLMNNYCICN